jgi:glycosyltransferase involved in cell wall biosynthesis
MKILFVDNSFPMPDRASSEVRMYAIVSILASLGVTCSYHVRNTKGKERLYGETEVARHRTALQALGVQTFEKIGLESVLQRNQFDAVFFKYFYTAEKQARLVRIWQPSAKVIVDSVDLVYARLATKATASGSPEDQVAAQQTKERELATYAAADLVVTVSDDEERTLRTALPHTPTFVIPNIHQLPEVTGAKADSPTLVFVGTFTHEPNVDAVVYFAREVWPSILSRVPTAKCFVIGSKPPDIVQALADASLKVTGYVPDTFPYLNQSWLSIAPLRFGAGMKGKVGEAMAAGLAVVTTSFGAEGFGATEADGLYVADDALRFADITVRLLGDEANRVEAGQRARAFIARHYGIDAARARLTQLLALLPALRIQRTVSWRGARREFRRLRSAWDRIIGWRIGAVR